VRLDVTKVADLGAPTAGVDPALRPTSSTPGGGMMRWTLRTKLALGLAGIVMAIMGVSLVLLTMSTRSRLMENYRHFAVQTNDVAIAGLENAMISRNPAEISSVLQAIDHREGFRGVFIVDKRGEIKHSTNATGVGRVLSKDDLTCRVCPTAASATGRTLILPPKDGERISGWLRPSSTSPAARAATRSE
jgi:hypothetical protein